MKEQNSHHLLSKHIKNQLQATQTHTQIVNGLRDFVETLTSSEQSKIKKSRNSNILKEFLQCNNKDLDKKKCLGAAVQNYCHGQIDRISNCFMSDKDKKICSGIVTQYFQCAAKVGKKLYFSSIIDY